MHSRLVLPLVRSVQRAPVVPATVVVRCLSRDTIDALLQNPRRFSLSLRLSFSSRYTRRRESRTSLPVSVDLGIPGVSGRFRNGKHKRDTHARAHVDRNPQLREEDSTAVATAIHRFSSARCGSTSVARDSSHESSAIFGATTGRGRDEQEERQRDFC